MKICLINNLYDRFGRGGGAEQVTEILAKGLTNHEVFTISTKPRRILLQTSGPDYYLNSLFPELALLPVILRLGWHLLDLFGWRKAGQVKRILQKEKPDLVVTHNLMGLGAPTARMIQRLNIKHVHVLHDLQLIHPSGVMFLGQEGKLNSLPAKIYTALHRYFIGKPQLVISPSQWLLDLHLQHGLFNETKTKHLLNPEDGRMQTQATKSREDYFLFVGQLAEHKGVRRLVEVFTELNLGVEKFKLKIAGKGALTPLVEAAAQRCPEIEYLGQLPNRDIHQLMARANCLIIPSLAYENSPTVILEALKNSLPVLGSDFGGVAELLQSKFLLFTPDKESLRERILVAQKHQAELRQEFQKIRQRVHQPSVAEYFAEIKKELW